MIERERKTVSPLSRAKNFLLTISILSSIIILFLLIPLIFLILVAGLEGVLEATKSREALFSIFLSMEAGAVAATISTIFGIPLAYLLSRTSFPGRSILEGLLDLPLVMPHTVAGIAILLAFSSRAPLGPFFTSLGLRVEDSLWGTIMAMSYVSAPFAVNFARQGFESIDISLEQVARSLGSSQFRVFFTVSLPLAIRSIITGWLMAMARAVSEVGAIMIVAYHPIVGSVLVYEWFTTRGLVAAASLSVLLLAASLMILVGLRILKWKGWAT